MSTAVALGISLEVSCSEACAADAFRLYTQLRDGNYDECSVLPIPRSLDEWREAHGTARKRANRAERRGYQAGILHREAWTDDIYAINTSASYRQGRPMATGYRLRPVFTPLPDYPCARHAIRVTGVFDSNSNRVVAYLVMIRAGELALVSQILGHADHLKNEIMYLLFQHALRREIDADPDGMVVYNRHDGGTDGLRWFKERMGFLPTQVAWLS